MKRSNAAILFASVLLCTTVPQINPIPNDVIVAEAHSGRTDSSGGHKDNKNKSGLGHYHYHCGGHPAHLHKNGVCPFSGNSSKTATSSSKTGTSDTIKKAQEILNDLGYDAGTADGIMGQKTKKAVEQFQKDNGMTIDGIIGKQVKEALGIS